MDEINETNALNALKRRILIKIKEICDYYLSVLEYKTMSEDKKSIILRREVNEFIRKHSKKNVNFKVDLDELYSYYGIRNDYFIIKLELIIHLLNEQKYCNIKENKNIMNYISYNNKLFKKKNVNILDLLDKKEPLLYYYVDTSLLYCMVDEFNNYNYYYGAYMIKNDSSFIIP